MSTGKRNNEDNVGSIRQPNVKNASKKKKEKCTPKEMKFCFYARFSTIEQAYGDMPK